MIIMVERQSSSGIQLMLNVRTNISETGHELQ